MPILDETGKPVTAVNAVRRCKCGSRDLYVQTGFGGSSAVVCNECGEQLTSIPQEKASWLE